MSFVTFVVHTLRAASLLCAGLLVGCVTTSVPFDPPEMPFAINPPQLDFPQSCLGEFADLTVTLFNTGSLLAQIDSITSADTPRFTVLASPTPLFVPGGGSVAFTVRYTPQSNNEVVGPVDLGPLEHLQNRFEETSERATLAVGLGLELLVKQQITNCGNLAVALKTF